MAKRIPQAVLEDALRKAGGIPAGAAKLLECHRSTVTRRIEKSEALQKLIEELQDELVDIAEISMASMVRNPKHKQHFNACRLVLETKGKHRGWTKQVDIHIDKPVPITFTQQQGALA